MASFLAVVASLPDLFVSLTLSLQITSSHFTLIYPSCYKLRFSIEKVLLVKIQSLHSSETEIEIITRYLISKSSLLEFLCLNELGGS